MANYTDPTVVSIAQSSTVQKGAIVALVGGILSLFIPAGFWLQIHTLQQDTTQSQKDLVTAQAELTGLSPVVDNLNKYNAQATGLHALFDNQRDWKAVLTSLDAYLYKPMMVSSLSITDQGAVALTGNVADYKAYAHLYTSLTDPSLSGYITALQVGSVTKTAATDGKKSEVDFSLTFTLGSNLLQAHNLQAQINRLNDRVTALNAQQPTNYQAQVASLTAEAQDLSLQLIANQNTYQEHIIASIQQERTSLKNQADADSLARMTDLNKNLVTAVQQELVNVSQTLAVSTAAGSETQAKISQATSILGSAQTNVTALQNDPNTDFVQGIQGALTAMTSSITALHDQITQAGQS